MHLLMPIAVAALGLIACGDDEPPGEWAIYTEILHQQPARSADLARCAALGDATLAGDCALTVALAAADAEGVSAETYCPQIPPGLWRQECLFIAAEKARSAGRIDTAILLCEQTGRFAPDCAFHLWQRAMRTLAKRIVLETMPSQQQQMRQTHARWSARVGHISDFDTIFWRKFFRAVWDGVPRVDPEICADLDADISAHCRLGAHIHLDHTLRASLLSDDWESAFCAGPAPRVSMLASLPESFPELDRFPDHPAYQAIVEAFHHGKCSLGELPDHPDPPRRTISARTPLRPQERTDIPTQSR